jgi:hypothetical protein
LVCLIDRIFSSLSLYVALRYDKCESKAFSKVVVTKGKKYGSYFLWFES